MPHCLHRSQGSSIASWFRQASAASRVSSRLSTLHQQHRWLVVLLHILMNTGKYIHCLRESLRWLYCKLDSCCSAAEASALSLKQTDSSKVNVTCARFEPTILGMCPGRFTEPEMAALNVHACPDTICEQDLLKENKSDSKIPARRV
ncbi:hypothetical protein NDU88_003297 [Pleurodeles waltl]|uniref:Uncharacterized protein n=1 Tax=Pleurodeles waltl TaxID=8319 RepID=A0AAV7NK98_PLEWA|nr:hypothetical protein NDU88_003297 [Pleurodeles waltl]